MGHHNNNFPIVKNYTTTALLSFATIFFLFAAFSKCSGPFKKNSSHHVATHEAAHDNKAEHKEAPKH